jgi:hypothetical protein
MKNSVSGETRSIVAGEAPAVPAPSATIQAFLLEPVEAPATVGLKQTPEILLERIAARGGLTSVAAIERAFVVWRESKVATPFIDIVHQYENGLKAILDAAPEMQPMKPAAMHKALCKGQIHPERTAAICLELGQFYTVTPSVFPHIQTGPEALNMLNKAIELSLVPSPARIFLAKVLQPFDLPRLVEGSASPDQLTDALLRRADLLVAALDDSFCPPSLRDQETIFQQMVDTIRFVANEVESDHSSVLLGLRRSLASSFVAKIGSWLKPIADKELLQFEYGDANQETAKAGALLYASRMFGFLDKLQDAGILSEGVMSYLDIVLFSHRKMVCELCGPVYPKLPNANSSMEEFVTLEKRASVRKTLAASAHEFTNKVAADPAALSEKTQIEFFSAGLLTANY